MLNVVCTLVNVVKMFQLNVSVVREIVVVMLEDLSPGGRLLWPRCLWLLL